MIFIFSDDWYYSALFIQNHGGKLQVYTQWHINYALSF